MARFQDWLPTTTEWMFISCTVAVWTAVVALMLDMSGIESARAMESAIVVSGADGAK